MLLEALYIRAGSSVFMTYESTPNPLHLKHVKLDCGVNGCSIKANLEESGSCGIGGQVVKGLETQVQCSFEQKSDLEG